MRDANKTIWDMIDKASATIISSVDENGFPNTKAMLPPRKRNGIKEIYLTTNTSSMRVKHYTANPKACVYFYDKRLKASCWKDLWRFYRIKIQKIWSGEKEMRCIIRKELQIRIIVFLNLRLMKEGITAISNLKPFK